MPLRLRAACTVTFHLCLAVSLASAVQRQQSVSDPSKTAQDAKKKEHTNQNIQMSLEQQDVLWRLIVLGEELKAEPDRATAASLRARIADMIWRTDAEAARAIMLSAFESVRRAIREGSAQPRTAAEPDHLDRARRNALALKEILSLVGRHDRRVSEAWLKEIQQDRLDDAQQAEATASYGRQQDRVELLMQLATELAESSPSSALELAVTALSGDYVPQSFGDLLFSLSARDSEMGYRLLEAGVATLRRSGAEYNPVLVSIANYAFSFSGAANRSLKPRIPALLISYFMNLAIARALSWRDARSTGREALVDSEAQLLGFLSARVVPIVQTNAPERLLQLQSLMNELSIGLTAEQRHAISTLASLQQQTAAVSTGLRLDYESQLERAEHEPTPWVRDTLLRGAALALMTRDADQAIKAAEKISDIDMRRQTEDDVNLHLLSEKLRSRSYAEGRKQALKLNDTSLKAKTLAELAAAASSESRDTVQAGELLSEAYSVALKADDAPDKVAALLIVAEHFSKFDLIRAFDPLSDAVKAINRLKSGAASPRRRSPNSPVAIQVISKLNDRELSTSEDNVIESLDFGRLGLIVKHDYMRTRFLGESLDSKFMRARFLIGIARTLLRSEE